MIDALYVLFMVILTILDDYHCVMWFLCHVMPHTFLICLGNYCNYIPAFCLPTAEQNQSIKPPVKPPRLFFHMLKETFCNGHINVVAGGAYCMRCGLPMNFSHWVYHTVALGNILLLLLVIRSHHQHTTNQGYSYCGCMTGKN